MIDKDAEVLKMNRILVSLDTSARGQAALQAAVRIALNSSAELQGLFVEDEDLVRLASLPFVREVDFASASPRELHLGNMERALRAAAEDAQRSFAHTLQQLDLHWTFRVVRGTIAQASLAAAVDVDLLVIGQQGRSPRFFAGGFLPTRSKSDKRVVAVFDGSPSAYRTLALANSLVAPDSPALSVLVIADDGDEVTRQCVGWLKQEGIRAEIDKVINPSEDTIVDYVRKWPPNVLVINRDSKFTSDSQIYRLVNEFDCPLILC
jgi:nucleotide-binding universal stress UspA family protein